jgi:hypothetical protein
VILTGIKPEIQTMLAVSTTPTNIDELIKQAEMIVRALSKLHPDVSTCATEIFTPATASNNYNETKLYAAIENQH